jgi:hypothetical protein
VTFPAPREDISLIPSIFRDTKFWPWGTSVVDRGERGMKRDKQKNHRTCGMCGELTAQPNERVVSYGILVVEYKKTRVRGGAMSH